MGSRNKLLMEWDGEIAVRRVVRAALDAGIDDVIAVVMAGDSQVADALHGLRIRLVENRDHADGIASSIRAGIASVDASHAGALVMLADMPLVAPRHLAPMLEAFAPTKRDAIAVPYFGDRRGNPVLWGRDHFSELMTVTGDVGARGLLQRRADCIVRVDMPDDAVLVDFDTPQDWARLHARAS